MPDSTVRVRNLKETLRALQQADRDAAKEVRAELKKVGEVVANEARGLFAAIDQRSAAGFKTRVRRAGVVVVEQSRRKTTGLRPDYGALQMRKALLPALDAKSGDVERALEDALDRVADDFNRGGLL